MNTCMCAPTACSVSKVNLQCFIFGKVPIFHQIITLCLFCLIPCTFVAFVEISLLALTDNMVLIQNSWIDNPIRLQECKAVYSAWCQPGSLQGYLCLWRQLLSTGCMAFYFILDSGMWAELFSHHFFAEQVGWCLWVDPSIQHFDPEHDKKNFNDWTFLIH